jgi:hypothetical protein
LYLTTGQTVRAKIKVAENTDPDLPPGTLDFVLAASAVGTVLTVQKLL